METKNEYKSAQKLVEDLRENAKKQIENIWLETEKKVAEIMQQQTNGGVSIEAEIIEIKSNEFQCISKKEKLEALLKKKIDENLSKAENDCVRNEEQPMVKNSSNLISPLRKNFFKHNFCI